MLNRLLSSGTGIVWDIKVPSTSVRSAVGVTVATTIGYSEGMMVHQSMNYRFRGSWRYAWVREPPVSVPVEGWLQFSASVVEE